MRKWIAFVLLLVGIIAVGCSNAKAPGSQTGAVPAPARKTIEQYFDFLSKQDFQSAYDLLSDSYRKGLQPSDLAGDRIRSASVKDVELIAAAQGPSNSYRVKVTVQVEISGPSKWQQGTNVREFVLTQYDGAWKIQGITAAQ
jgi:hypothetical protein